MSKRSFACSSWTPVAVADTTGFTANGYAGLQGGSSTQRIIVSELFMGGVATASAPTLMTFARDSTVCVTPTALTTGQSDGPIDPSTAALAAPPVSFTTAGTQPQRSATAGRLSLGFNAFGGIVRWVAPDLSSCFQILGNTASLGEMSLSAYTGGTPGLMNSHIIYEPL